MIYKSCVGYKNKIQNRLIALVPKCVNRFGDDKMFNFTKPFEQNRLDVRKQNSLSMVYLHDNFYLYDCMHEDYIIIPLFV